MNGAFNLQFIASTVGINMKKSDYSTFCLLCNKAFASPKNLKRHANYAHKLCDAPAFLCDFCHIGFVRWEDYEKHHSDRLLKTFARKTKKRKVKLVNPELVDVVPPLLL